MSSVAGTLVEPLSEEQIAALPTYAWDIAEIGHAAPPFTHVAGAESITDYCLAVRNANPLYLDPAAAAGGPFGGIVAPPTYVFKCAPMRRNELMHAQGYASPEEKQVRATPYAKSEIHFQRPIRLGDEITSSVTLEDKLERRGNKFITLRARATNQAGEDVATYAYTIIWEQGPREQPAGSPANGEARATAPRDEPDVAAEDRLPSLDKSETQDAIDRYSELTRVRPRVGSSLHSDKDFTRRTIFGGTVNMGVATAAYCSELLERAYGPDALLRPGARLEYKGIRPIRAGDEITLGGRVVERRADAHNCEIQVVARDGTLRGLATATVIPGRE